MDLSKIKTSFSFQIVLGFILSLTILWFYWPTMVMLFEALISNEDYSFGLLLPLVSVYIIYLNYPKIRQQVWNPSWLGLLIIFFGFALYAFGDLVAVLYLAPISLLIILTGLIFLLGGWSLMRLVWFPLILLFFMVPLPAMVIKNLTLPLQLISSRLAAGILSLIGVPLVLRGNVIDLGVRQLQIVEACSGLRYILSLFSLGMIYCYFYQRRLWKAAILLICLIPASILANAIRVAAMGLFPALQTGFLHSFSGWLIFVFCFVFLAFLNWFLDYLQPSVAYEGNQDKAPATLAPLGSGPSKSAYLIAALVLIIVCGPVTSSLSQAPSVPLLQTFDKFPMHLGPWQGHREFLDAAMAKAVGADDYLEASFANPEQGMVSLWIAFFESQQKALDRRIHSPLHCLTGSGWNIIGSRIIELAPGHPVRYLLMEQGGSRQVVFFWYLQRGRWLASEYDRYFYMGLDGLIKRRNDGAIVRLITPAAPTVESAQERLLSFTTSLIPILNKFIPN